MVESFEISFKSEIPFIRDARIKGIAISFKRFIKIVPKGLIQSFINSEPKDVCDIKRPNKTPATIPIIIFQCNFIIKFLRLCLIISNPLKLELTLLRQ